MAEVGFTARILTERFLQQINPFLLHIPRCHVCLETREWKPVLVMSRAELMDLSADSELQMEELSEDSLAF